MLTAPLTAYSRRQLLGLRSNCFSRSRVFVNEIAAVGLLHYRGKRAGALARSRQVRASVYKHDLGSKAEHIPIVPSCRMLRRQAELSRARVLRAVPRTTFTPPVNVGVFNAFSVHNKSASINEWISSSNLRLAALVET